MICTHNGFFLGESDGGQRPKFPRNSPFVELNLFILSDFVVWYFQGWQNVPHPAKWFVLQIKWRLHICDAETSSSFEHKILCRLVTAGTHSTNLHPHENWFGELSTRSDSHPDYVLNSFSAMFQSQQEKGSFCLVFDHKCATKCPFCPDEYVSHHPWWRHQMETFSALLALCAGNSPVTGEFPTQRPVTRSFDVFFDLRMNERLSKQSWGWWFETPSRPSWRHNNDKTSCHMTLPGNASVTGLGSCWYVGLVVILPQTSCMDCKNDYILRSLLYQICPQIFLSTTLYQMSFRFDVSLRVDDGLSEHCMICVQSSAARIWRYGPPNDGSLHQ